MAVDLIVDLVVDLAVDLVVDLAVDLAQGSPGATLGWRGCQQTPPPAQGSHGTTRGWRWPSAHHPGAGAGRRPTTTQALRHHEKL